MIALLPITYIPTNFPVEKVRESFKIDTSQQTTASYKEGSGLDVEDSKHTNGFNNQDEEIIENSNLRRQENSTKEYSHIVLERKLSQISEKLKQMLENDDELATPIMFSDVRLLFQELLGDISDSEIFLKMELVYLEQVVISNSWNSLTQGKIKSLLSLINVINKRSAWDYKSLQSTTNHLISSGFQIIKPVSYVETKDTKISS
jgi:hypothetical protein